MLQVLDGIKKFGDTLVSCAFTEWIGQTISEYQTSRTLIVVLITLLVIIILVGIVFIRKWKNKEFLPEVKEFVGVGSGRPRFRKRDKVLFYGRKMLRKVKSISGQAAGQGKKRRAVMRFARRLLQLKKETVPQQLKVPKKLHLKSDLLPKNEEP